MKKKLIYIAHPLRGDVVENINRVDQVCDEIAKERRDVVIFSPIHAFNFVDPAGPQDHVLDMCVDMVRRCDEVWVYGEAEAVRKSKGVQLEIATAEAYGIKVVDCSHRKEMNKEKMIFLSVQSDGCLSKFSQEIWKAHFENPLEREKVNVTIEKPFGITKEEFVKRISEVVGKGFFGGEIVGVGGE